MAVELDSSGRPVTTSQATVLSSSSSDNSGSSSSGVGGSGSGEGILGGGNESPALSEQLEQVREIHQRTYFRLGGVGPCLLVLTVVGLTGSRPSMRHLPGRGV